MTILIILALNFIGFGQQNDFSFTYEEDSIYIRFESMGNETRIKNFNNENLLLNIEFSIHLESTCKKHRGQTWGYKIMYDYRDKETLEVTNPVITKPRAYLDSIKFFDLKEEEYPFSERFSKEKEVFIVIQSELDKYKDIVILRKVTISDIMTPRLTLTDDLCEKKDDQKKVKKQIEKLKQIEIKP